MTGLGKEIARRRRQAPTTPPATPEMVRCSAGNDPARCCVGDPWAGITEMTLRTWGEPLPLVVIRTAAAKGIDPHTLDHHVEAVHGFEPHNDGYDDAVDASAGCVLAGGCEAGSAAP